MPLVQRSESDILRLQPFTDIMVNLVDRSGSMNRGLGAVYKTLYPEMAKRYKDLCEAEKIQIGTLYVYTNREKNAVVINLPTKNYWMDFTDLEDVRHCLRKLREYLTGDPARKLCTLAMPMMGSHNSNEDFSETWPLMVEYLDDLDNVIHVCMRPDRFPSEPQYLGIIGDRRLTRGLGYIDVVEDHVNKALKDWGLEPSFFTNYVSGGADGVDDCGCGKDRGMESVATRHGHPAPIICKADWDRFGKAAGMLRNRTVIDICTHVVAVKTPESVGTNRAIDLITDWNRTCHEGKKKRLYEVTLPKPSKDANS